MFYREAPEEGAFAQRLEKAVRRKTSKLAKYAEDYTTVLLVESSDLALMNETTIQNAVNEIRSAAEPPICDQLWYADTSIPDYLDFNMLAG